MIFQSSTAFFAVYIPLVVLSVMAVIFEEKLIEFERKLCRIKRLNRRRCFIRCSPAVDVVFKSHCWACVSCRFLNCRNIFCLFVYIGKNGRSETNRSIIGIICLVVVGISLLITQSNSNKIRVPRSLNKSTASILGSDAKLFDECFRAFVEAYNTREEGDGGLLNETDEFNNLQTQLKYVECDSIEKKEIVKKLRTILFLVWFSDDMETIKYREDSDGNWYPLEKKIATQEQLEQTEKYIFEIIDMYYK